MSYINKYIIADTVDDNGTYPDATGTLISEGGKFRIEATADTWGQIAISVNGVAISTAVYTADSGEDAISLANGDLVTGVVTSAGSNNNISLSLHRIGS